MLAIVAACVACRAAVPPLPGNGGPAWRELSTAHFVVWTDARDDDARALAARLERVRRVVHDVAFPDAPAGARAYVIAFRDRAELHAYLPAQLGAESFRAAQTPLGAPVVVMAAGGADHVVAHELAHVISFDVMPVQPRWFAEGLATYLETVRLDDATVELGEPRQDRTRALRRAGPLPIAQLFACERQRCMDARYYATASAFFAFLVGEHAAELAAYMRALAESPASASLAIADADRALARWLQAGHAAVRRFAAPRVDEPVAERVLADADALAARELVRTLCRR